MLLEGSGWGITHFSPTRTMSISRKKILREKKMGENNRRLILFVYNHAVVCKVIYHQFRTESRFGKDILTMIV